MMTTAAPTLNPFQKFDGTGAVHLGEVRPGGNAFTFCTGRHLTFSFIADSPVTCKACIKKANANGINPADPMGASLPTIPEMSGDRPIAAHDDPDPIGLPYASAEFDDEDRFHLVCPACGEKCYPASTDTEDDLTKGASLAYAAHYTLMRRRQPTA